MRRAGIPRLLAAAVAALLVAACGREPPPTSARAGDGFAARCAALPETAAEVIAAPVTVVEDDSRTRAELTALFERAQPGHAATGLTQTRSAYDTSIAFTGVRERDPPRTCVRPAIRVTLSLTPITVFVARELADDPCRHAVVREHEMKHVAVYKRHLADAVERLAASLDGAFAGRLFTAATSQGAQDDAAAAVATHLGGFEQGEAGRMHARQAEVDSPDEYARVAAACTAP